MTKIPFFLELIHKKLGIKHMFICKDNDSLIIISNIGCNKNYIRNKNNKNTLLSFFFNQTLGTPSSNLVQCTYISKSNISLIYVFE